MTTRTPEHRPHRGWQPQETPNGRFTVPLESEAPRELVGGKAAGLMLANQAGFRVPDGFVITTEAFDIMVDLVVPVAQTTAELRQALCTKPLPAKLVDELEMLTDGGAGLWAVRSSALDEDGRRSFAGQQHTVLNVTGLDALVSAVREVWASLYDPAALIYRARLALDGLPGSMAVVVQRMVNPRAAGVVFSRNPLTPESPELVVSAASGLGTSVVGGEACDTYYLERPSGYVVRRETVGEPVLRPEDLEELSTLALRTEGLLTTQQAVSGADVEWAIEDDIIYVLQARPITGYHHRDVQATVWSNANVGEALPGVATPMTWSVLKEFSQRGFDRAFGALGLDVPESAELVGSFHGRVFLNLSDFVSIAGQIPLLNPARLYSIAGGGGAELLEGAQVVDPHETTASPIEIKGFTPANWRFVSRLPVTIPRIVSTQISMPFVSRIWDAYFDRRRAQLFERDLYRLSHSALRDELARLDRLFNMTGLVMLSVSSNFLLSYVITTEVLRWFGAEEIQGKEQDLLSDLGVKSAEPGQQLLELGRIARRSLRLRRLIGQNPSHKVLSLLMQNAQSEDVRHFLDELEAFRGHYGHRAPREAELSTPRWRENLSFVFDVIKGFLDAPHLPSPGEVSRGRENRQRETHALVARGFAPGVREVFQGLLAVTRANARLRESTRARVVEALDMYRYFLLECGRRMVQTGLLHGAEDVFFLKKPEVLAWLDDVTAGRDFKRRVIVRKAVFEAFESLPDPPSTFIVKGDEPIMRSVETDDTYDASDFRELRGLPASAGRVTGRARVVMNPDGAVLEPGEILVVPYADVGWTPLFISAGAVVMGLGGPLSHAAIVAREFHIPAVVNAHGVCDKVKTGDLVTVDGDRGLVLVREAK